MKRDTAVLSITGRPGAASAVVLATIILLAGACGTTEDGSPSPSASPSADAPTASPTATQTAATTAPPTTTPPPSVPPTWETFRSDRLGYAIAHPEGWVVTPATSDWPSIGWPGPGDAATDRFGASASSTPFISVASDVLEPGEIGAARRAEIDGEMALACRVEPETSVTADATEGRRREMVCFGRDHVIEAFFENDGRIFLLYWLSAEPLTDVDRRTFDGMVSSLDFGP